jgi:flagellar motor switch protein FliG
MAALSEVTSLSDNEIQSWLSKIGESHAHDLELALLGADTDVRERIMCNMSPRACSVLKAELQELERKVSFIESLLG